MSGASPARSPAWPIALATAWVGVASVASAHVESSAAIGFVTGFRHPWSGLDHVLAMVAVGLWGAQLGAPAIWLLPITFPLVMAMGATMALAGFALPGVEIGIPLSAVLLGAVVASETRPRLPVAAALVGCFAIFHGHAHGTELPPGQSGLLYSAGFVVATGSLHAIGIAVGLVHRWPAGRLAMRCTGALIGIVGAWLLWKAVT